MTAVAYSPLRELLDGLAVDVETDLASGGEAAFSQRFRTYRYALTRTWRPDTQKLPWVMLNPSTADAFELDPTVRRCVDFSQRFGAGGLIVLNLYAYRSTNPKALRDVEPVGELNDAVIRRLLDALNGPPRTVMCAWGASAEHGRGQYVADLIRQAGHEPMCLGRTSSGAPRHPLYVAGKTPMEAL